MHHKMIRSLSVVTLARILHEAAMKVPLHPRQSMATGENSKNTNCHLGARRLLASSSFPP